MDWKQPFALATVYAALKILHVTTVTVSLTLFLLRAGLQFGGVAWRRSAVLRILPHVVDTVLLAAAVGLCITIRQYPFVDGWLTAKVLALVVYIAVGRIALAEATSPGRRMAAFAVSVLAVAYILSVALSHSALPGMG